MGLRRDEENNEESCFLRSNSQETQNMLSSSGFGYQPLSPMSASTSPYGKRKSSTLGQIEFLPRHSSSNRATRTLSDRRLAYARHHASTNSSHASTASTISIMLSPQCSLDNDSIPPSPYIIRRIPSTASSTDR